ncbi:hypothetical protein COOONC_01306 [Cooperia oncophora]
MEELTVERDEKHSTAESSSAVQSDQQNDLISEQSDVLMTAKGVTTPTLIYKKEYAETRIQKSVKNKHVPPVCQDGEEVGRVRRICKWFEKRIAGDGGHVGRVRSISKWFEKKHRREYSEGRSFSQTRKIYDRKGTCAG